MRRKEKASFADRDTLRVDRPPIRAFDAERLEQLLLGVIQRVLSGFLVDQRGEKIGIAAVVNRHRAQSTFSAAILAPITTHKVGPNWALRDAMGGAMLLALDVAVTGLGRVVRRLPRLLAIYWLPWLLGTIALLILEAVVQDQLRLGDAPDWARNIVWAPFAGMAYLMLLRWVLNDEPPARAINLEMERKAWIAAPIVAAWFVASITVTGAPMPLLHWLVLPPDVRDYRWEDVAPYYYALQFTTWLVDGVLTACFFGLIVVVERYGWPNLSKHWQLLRRRPVRLLSISLLAAAASGGAWRLGSQALAWLGVYKLAPQGMIPWRDNIQWAFVYELACFPLAFLNFAIQGCIMAEAYRRLVADSSRP